MFEHEPELRADLGMTGRVVLSPHIAGGTHERRFSARRLCAENVASVLKG